MQFPLKNPSPDFEQFAKMLKGERAPEKVHFAEVFVSSLGKEG